MQIMFSIGKPVMRMTIFISLQQTVSMLQWCHFNMQRKRKDADDLLYCENTQTGQTRITVIILLSSPHSYEETPSALISVRLGHGLPVGLHGGFSCN